MAKLSKIENYVISFFKLYDGAKFSYNDNELIHYSNYSVINKNYTVKINFYHKTINNNLLF